MDNFYNSVSLTTTLLEAQTNVCGTLRTNRGEPADLKAPTLQKGQTIARHNGQAMVLVWKDKRNVKMISSFHKEGMKTVEVHQKLPWKSHNALFSTMKT